MVQFGLEDVLPLHLATVTWPDSHPLRGQTGEVLGFAVRHRRGLVLFDTGIGVGSDLIDRVFRPVSCSIDEELGRHGHVATEVTAVVNSHLHFDHCGNNPRFPGVPIYAQADELAAARGPRYTVPAWIDFEGAEYRSVSDESTVASGIRVLRTPGHTSGHQSLVLDARDGPIVLAGQAIYSPREYEDIRRTGAPPVDDPPPDPEAYVASARRLIELRPRRVHFSHDSTTWDDPIEAADTHQGE